MELVVDKLIQSRRKTISIEINREGQLIVRTPMRVSQKYLRELLLSRKDWILEKQTQARQKHEKFGPKEYVEGEIFLFMGNEYPLSFAQKQERPLIHAETGFSMRRSDQSWAAELFQRWYRRQAELYLPERVEQLSGDINIPFQALKITNAEKRWGSCNVKKNLCLSWRLIMTPDYVIDYVIIHELSHIEHLDHSKAFWLLVARKFPRHHEAKIWLKHNSYKCHL